MEDSMHISRDDGELSIIQKTSSKKPLSLLKKKNFSTTLDPNKIKFALNK